MLLENLTWPAVKKAKLGTKIVLLPFDEDKMAKYERYNAEKGDYYARFHPAPRRPDWHPIVGGM